MMQRLRWLPVVLTAACCWAGPAPFADRYAAGFERALDHSLTLVPAMAATADVVAPRLLAGHALAAGGSMKGFDIEALGRAGGLCGLRAISPKTVWQSGDVVLYAILGGGDDADVKAVSALRDKGVYVVLFASAGPVAAQADAWFDTGLDGHGLTASIQGQGVAALDGVVNVANLWAFTAELVAACTRRGKMPTLYQSIFMDGSRERNAKYRAKAFHDDLTIQPIRAGELGPRYLRQVREHVSFLRQPAQQQAVARAAELAVKAQRQGRHLWAWMFGHYLPYVCGTPGDPGPWKMFPGAVNPLRVAELVKAGDVFAHFGYVDIEVSIFEAVKKAGASSIAVVAGLPGGAPPPHSDVPDVWIDPHWVRGDAELPIDGYDIKILPPSGAGITAVYWMLVAETNGRLAAP